MKNVGTDARVIHKLSYFVHIVGFFFFKYF